MGRCPALLQGSSRKPTKETPEMQGASASTQAAFPSSTVARFQAALLGAVAAAVLMMEMLPALTLTPPAFPVFPWLACEMIPVGERDIAPSIVSSPATLTETPPPAPRPEVLLVIAPERAIFRLPATTVTPPPSPEEPA